MVAEELYKCSKCQKSIFLDYQGKGVDLHYNVGNKVDGNEKLKFKFCASCWEGGEKNNYLGNKKYWISECEKLKRADIQNAQEEDSNDSFGSTHSQNPSPTPINNNSKTIAIIGVATISLIIIVGLLVYHRFTSETNQK